MKIGAFKISKDLPEINKPIAIAMLKPWIDVGRVGSLSISQLCKSLNAIEIARLSEPGMFFDFTRYRPYMKLVEDKKILEIPNTIIYYAKDNNSGNNYLFLKIREPHMFGENYAKSITQVLTHFEVSEYCRIGGMYDSVPHTRPIIVTGTLTDKQAKLTEGLVSPRRNTYQGPTSIVNLVAEMATSKDMLTTSLMAHLPQYAQLDEDHMATYRLMQVLSSLYGFSNTFYDPEKGEKQYEDLDLAIEKNSQIKSLVKQLEIYYDNVLSSNASSNEEFSEDVETFLNEMGNRLSGPEDYKDYIPKDI
jgi:proteasome assembly chaperone (PAC2) family protein|tara:strand:+ start:1664 stop:2578 length:915 start_codon:yes stop_codon:yes gene_type:complete